MRVKKMIAQKNGKGKYFAALHNFGPLFKRGPHQGLLNFNSWQAQVFIEILGTMLVEQEFIDLIFEPITDTYAKFIREANRNIWTLPQSKHLVVRVKYRRHAQRLAELLGAILTKSQFIKLVLQPIIKTYMNTYTDLVLETSFDDNETLVGSDWKYNLEPLTSTPYKRLSFDETITSAWEDSMSALLKGIY